MAQDDPYAALWPSMIHFESGGNPNAVSPKGAIGVMQIMPETAKRYGVAVGDLYNPEVNTRLGKRIFLDLVKQYKGDVRQALAAYNAGTGDVSKGLSPDQTQVYVKNVLGRAGGAFAKIVGEGAASAAERAPVPDSDLPPELVRKTRRSPVPESDLPSEFKGTSPKHIQMEIKKEIPLPLGARAAGYLPAAGQFAGEALGAGGAALIPGVGETAVGEYAGAVAGGAAGSGLGAEAENAIRKAYGLPPVSVGTEAAIGGGTSALGGLLPPVMRTRAAGAVGRATKRAFGPALEAAEGLKGALERRLGTTAIRAAGRISEVAQPVIRGYRSTLNAGLKVLGSQYDTLLAPFRFIPVGNTASQALAGRAGQLLDMSGKPLRKALQDEINAQPMTVTRAQEVLSFIKQWRRSLDPDTQRMAGAAIDQVQKALEADRDVIVGPAVSRQLKAIDAQYAQQLARFPMKAVRKATTEAGAADAILKAKPNETGRVLDVIKQMKAAGSLPVLRQATATKIFAGAEGKTGLNEAERIVNVRKAVDAIPRQIFDELYGQGARDSWLQLGKEFDKKQMELLENPTEAKAIMAEVQKFLQSPTAGKKFADYLTHKIGWIGMGALGAAGHYGAGVGFGTEAAVAVGGLFGIKMWEGIAHSRLAMHYMEQAATSKSSERTARMIFAAIDAALLHPGAEALSGVNPSTETTTEVNP